MKSAYDLSNAGLPRLKAKLLKQIEQPKQPKPKSAYVPGKIPPYAYL